VTADARSRSRRLDDIARERIPALIALYGGALFTLVTAPPGSVSRIAVQRVVNVIAYGAASGPGPVTNDPGLSPA
jgi:hypothetical protein